MSLDVYLTMADPKPRPQGSGIFIRERGEQREISREEWDRLNPGREPVVFAMEADFESREVFWLNITHNLGRMAREAGIYEYLWRPEEVPVKRASDLVAPLQAGLKRLLDAPAHFRQFNPSNGWGDYQGLVQFVEAYLSACKEYPDADVSASR